MVESNEPDLLYRIADDLRIMSLDALHEGGGDVPQRSYVEIGNTLAPVEFGDDCTNQLTVTAGPLMPDLITDLVQRRHGKPFAAMLWKARFTITLLHCHPMWSGDDQDPLPTPDQLDTEARAHYRDGWQLARVLSWRWTHGELVPSYSFDFENTQWVSPAMQARAPQGGIRGWDLALTVSIHDHYEPDQVTEPFDQP